MHRGKEPHTDKGPLHGVKLEQSNIVVNSDFLPIVTTGTETNLEVKIVKSHFLISISLPLFLQVLGTQFSDSSKLHWAHA
jgi:hypothetical protein